MEITKTTDFSRADSAPGITAGTLRLAAWGFNRVRCMTPAEVGHRALRALAHRAERLGCFAPTDAVPAELAPPCRPWIHKNAHVDPAPYLAAAERLVGGRLDLFAMKNLEVGSSPSWNRDPKSGIEAPLAFGKTLNYRDPRLVGDIKYLWEANRHLHLVTLAQAYALSADPRYCNALRQHLESWFDACPYGKGPNWCSALEVAIRLINWAVAWQILGGPGSKGFEDARGGHLLRRWVRSVHEHCHFVRGHFSFHSSANNHLIGEAAGLFIAAITWPYLPQSREWLATAKGILEREALLQNAPDGVNREQAISYQQFDLDMLILALLAGRANGYEFPSSFAKRIQSMLEFLASIMDAGGNVPMLGDDDDGTLVRLAPDGRSRYRSLLATGAVLFRRADFRIKAGDLDDKTRWLLGNGAERVYGELDTARAKLPVRRAFEDGGYYVLGSDFESADEIRLVADAGPLGYQSIAAHGHADALSFTLSVGGTEFLVDPGTYAYHTQDEWRAYFRGTAAHNTVRIDGLDQSVSGGKFMWLRKAQAMCTTWSVTPKRDLFEAWHDGYMRLDDPVKHWRRITLDKAERHIVVEDTLEMSGAHQVELYFHWSENVRVELDGYHCTATQGERTVSLQLPRLKAARMHLLRGSLAPVGGWISRSFDHKEPAATVLWRAWLAGMIVLRTQISC